MAASTFDINDVADKIRAKGTKETELSSEEKEWLHLVAEKYCSNQAPDQAPAPHNPNRFDVYPIESSFILFSDTFFNDKAEEKLMIEHIVEQTAHLDLEAYTKFFYELLTIQEGLAAMSKNPIEIDNLRRLPGDKQKEFALSIGERERAKIIEKAQPPVSHEKRGTMGANGLFVPDPIKREIKPATSALGAGGLNVIPGGPSIPTRAPSAPKPDHKPPASRSSGLDVIPGNAMPSPYPPSTPVRDPSHQPAYRSPGPQYFQPPAAAPKQKLLDPKKILKDLQQQKKEEERVKIIAELSLYKEGVEADLAAGKEYDFLGFGVSKNWKKAAVEKVLTHLDKNYSIEDLALVLQDKIALEDGGLNKIVSKIDGYPTAIQNAKGSPSPRK